MRICYCSEDPYLGISQGYILGTVMTALNPDVRRVALQVGGGAFSHMMSRASPFRTYLTLLDFSMDNALEKQKLIASYQRGFDRCWRRDRSGEF